MAGSRKWFIYTTDAGTDYAIELDESNTEAVNGGTQDYPDAGTLADALPRNYKPRRLVYENAAGTQRLTIVALTPTIFGGAATAVPTIVSGGVTYALRRNIGETSRRPIGVDTGLTDGDAT